MVEKYRGHDHNIAAKIIVGDRIGITDPDQAADLVLDRLTPQEIEQLFSCKVGQNIAIVNSQHYEMDPTFPELQLGSSHYGVRILKPGINKEIESSEPVLEADGPLALLILKGYFLYLNPGFIPSKKLLKVSQIILGDSSNIPDFLTHKYGATMDARAFKDRYYIRTYKIARFLQAGERFIDIP